MTPALESLQAQAPAINEAITRFGPFTDAASPAVQTLGDFAQEGRRLFPAIRPLVRDLRDLGRPLRPAMGDLAAGFGSFDDTGGIEELMRFIFFYTGSVNGVDRARALRALDPRPQQLLGAERPAGGRLRVHVRPGERLVGRVARRHPQPPR